MASCDDPGTSMSTDAPIRSWETEDRDVGDLGIGSSGEGRPPRPAPDLGTSFPPSFACDHPFVNGTPSGEVLLRLPRRFDHIGEPAPSTTPGEQSKEMEELRKQISALSSSVQTSFATITARLENHDPSLRRDISDPSVNLRDRSVSVPGPYPSRSAFSEPSRNRINDRYSGFEAYRDRSPSPYSRNVDNNQNYPSFSAPARSANVSYGNRSIDFIKVAQYDGKSSWKDYLVQFELAAHANRWDKHTSAVRLACSLRGSARALLSDLNPEVRYDYERLVTTLTERFEPENQCEIYKAQMKQRIRKRDEPLPELAQDIKRLTRMAYPSAVLDLRDNLSTDCFIEALNDADMELFICQKEPERLEDAVRIALKYEAFSQSRRKRLTPAKTGIRMQFEDIPKIKICEMNFKN